MQERTRINLLSVPESREVKPTPFPVPGVPSSEPRLMDLPETRKASSSMNRKPPQSSVHHLPRVIRLSSGCQLQNPARYREDLSLSDHCFADCEFPSVSKTLEKRQSIFHLAKCCFHKEGHYYAQVLFSSLKRGRYLERRTKS